MSEADKMLEELGYKKYEGLRCIDYINNYGIIRIDKDSRNIIINKEEDDDIINIQELQAINEKVKELRWLNE